MQAKFCKQPILSQILGVLKSPTAEIVFLDFRQIEAVFGKTNYTTFCYLVMSIYRQNMNDIKILSLAAKFQFCAILTGNRGSFIDKLITAKKQIRTSRASRKCINY